MSKEIKEPIVEAAKQPTIEEKESKVLMPKEAELEQYRYGDVVITCACGKDTIIKHPMFNNVETAVQLPPLYTDNKHFLGLACEHCKAKLTLRMIPAIQPPAYDFSHEGFDTPKEVELTWKTGEDASSYNVYLSPFKGKEEGEEEESLKLLGTTTEPSFKLKLEENTPYRYRVDTIYGQEVLTSPVVFLSTEAQPEKKEDEKATPKQIEVPKDTK